MKVKWISWEKALAGIKSGNEPGSENKYYSASKNSVTFFVLELLEHIINNIPRIRNDQEELSMLETFLSEICTHKSNSMEIV